jgi:hypothetical protein
MNKSIPIMFLCIAILLLICNIYAVFSVFKTDEKIIPRINESTSNRTTNINSANSIKSIDELIPSIPAIILYQICTNWTTNSHITSVDNEFLPRFKDKDGMYVQLRINQIGFVTSNIYLQVNHNSKNKITLLKNIKTNEIERTIVTIKLYI